MIYPQLKQLKSTINDIIPTIKKMRRNNSPQRPNLAKTWFKPTSRQLHGMSTLTSMSRTQTKGPLLAPIGQDSEEWIRRYLVPSMERNQNGMDTQGLNLKKLKIIYSETLLLSANDWIRPSATKEPCMTTLKPKLSHLSSNNLHDMIATQLGYSLTHSIVWSASLSIHLTVTPHISSRWPRKRGLTRFQRLIIRVVMRTTGITWTSEFSTRVPRKRSCLKSGEESIIVHMWLFATSNTRS